MDSSSINITVAILQRQLIRHSTVSRARKPRKQEADLSRPLPAKIRSSHTAHNAICESQSRVPRRRQRRVLELLQCCTLHCTGRRSTHSIFLPQWTRYRESRRPSMELDSARRLKKGEFLPRQAWSRSDLLRAPHEMRENPSIRKLRKSSGSSRQLSRMAFSRNGWSTTTSNQSRCPTHSQSRGYVTSCLA